MRAGPRRGQASPGAPPGGRPPGPRFAPRCAPSGARAHRLRVLTLRLRRACAGASWWRSPSASCSPRVYRFWLRDSSLVGVEHVKVTGVTANDAKRVRAALAAAHDHDHSSRAPGRLDQAVAGYPVVRALEVTTDFPHGLEIRVVEHGPAALARACPWPWTAPSSGDCPVDGALPTIARTAASRASAWPTRWRSPPRAWPAPLQPRCAAGSSGWTATPSGASWSRCGRAPSWCSGRHDVRAKWTAAARVLADQAPGADLHGRARARPAGGRRAACQTLAPARRGAAPVLGRRRTPRPPSPARRPATEEPATEPRTGTARRRGAHRHGHATGADHPPAARCPTDPPGAGGARRLPGNPRPLAELQGNPQPSLELTCMILAGRLTLRPKSTYSPGFAAAANPRLSPERRTAERTT